MKCGSYAVRWAVGLAEPCRERPTNPSQQRVLARLKAGRHPRSNKELGGELVVEVPGLEAVGISEGRKVGGSGMVGQRGKHFVGYARRPGGMRLIEEGGGCGGHRGGEEDVARGPRWAYFDRRKRMRGIAVEGEEGEDAARAKRRAVEAREEDARVISGMIGQWEAACAQAVVSDMRDGEAAADDGGREAAEERGGEVVTRRELINRLSQAVRECASEPQHAYEAEGRSPEGVVGVGGEEEVGGVELGGGRGGAPWEEEVGAEQHTGPEDDGRGGLPRAVLLKRLRRRVEAEAKRRRGV